MPLMTAISIELMYAAAAAACAGLATFALLRLAGQRRRASAATLEALARDLTALRAENGSQSAIMIALSARFDELQRQLTTDARFATAPAGGASSSAYELAIRLARGGASVDELVSGCMVSRHEAELTLRLHGPQNRTGAARLSAVG